MSLILPDPTVHLDVLLKLGYPYGLRSTGHTLFETERRHHGEDKKETVRMKAMFKTSEQVQEWCANFSSDVPLSELMEQRQYLVDHHLLRVSTDQHVTSLSTGKRQQYLHN